MKQYLLHIKVAVIISLLALFVLPALSNEGSQPARGGARGQRGTRGSGRGRGQVQVDPAAQARLEQMGSRGIGVHDPSTIVKCKDTYWIFCTGRSSYFSKDLKT